MTNDERLSLPCEAGAKAIVSIDASGRISMVNSQAQDGCGYSRSELLGKSIEILVPAWLPTGDSSMPKTLFGDHGPVPRHGARDLSARRKDGSELTVEVGSDPFPTEGDILELSPVTDIARPDDTIADANYLASIVESSNDAIIGKGLDGRIRSWNRTAQTILGYTAEEAIGQNIAMLFPVERLTEEADIVERIRRGERVEHLETERRHKDGRLIPVSLTVSPIRNAQGAVVGASKTLRDISERRDAQQALVRSEAEFRASFEGAAVGKVLAEPTSRRILRANHALGRLLGYEPQDMVGRTCTEFVWLEDRADDDARYALLLGGGSDAHVCEQRYVRRDGTPIWVRVSATLAKVAESNQPILAVIAIEDIDARYRAQADLLATKRDLEIVVEQRTAALQQRDILLREVYHRVKNNLQIIDSLLVLQAQRISDSEARVAFKNLRGRVFALGLVHHQLMGSADLRSFDVAPFLQELLDNIHEGGANDDIKLSMTAVPLDVGLDFAVPLGLLVTELVTNALKHAFPNGTGKVSVVLERRGEGNITLIVSDDGRGYASSTASPHSLKAGLGTGIVAGLVAQLGGSMTTRSKNGTRTEIQIPETVL